MLEPFAVSASEAARLCGISRSKWFQLKDEGRTPEPFYIDRRVLWKTEDIRAFVANGCRRVSDE